MPSCPYVPVVRGVQAWNELVARRTDEASVTLQAMIGTNADPVSVAATTMARRWLTRLDREKVRQALTAYYADHVAFPDSLDALRVLPAARRPPAVDRWNKAWQYRLAEFKRLKGLTGQRYELTSGELGSDSDLKAALAVTPYGSRITVKPLRVITRLEGQSAIEFKSPGPPPRRTTVTEGARVDAVSFVRLVGDATLLSDGDQWQLVPMP